MPSKAKLYCSFLVVLFNAFNAFNAVVCVTEMVTRLENLCQLF